MLFLTTNAVPRTPCGPRFRNRVLTFGAAISLCTLVLTAQTLPQGVRKGASMAGITEYAFPNGLRVLLLPDSGGSTITVNITYLVGSRHEGAGESGMAHLLEQIPYTEVPQVKVDLPERVFNPNYERHELAPEMFVPRVYG